MPDSIKKFKRSIGELKNIFEFIDRFANKYALQAKLVHDVTLAVEEIFTNMVKYNPTGPNEIELHLLFAHNVLKIKLIDRESEPFDITKAQVYDLNQRVEQRPVGKLGIHFVKKIMDHLEYQHKNKRTVITMIKNLGETNV